MGRGVGEYGSVAYGSVAYGPEAAGVGCVGGHAAQTGSVAGSSAVGDAGAGDVASEAPSAVGGQVYCGHGAAGSTGVCRVGSRSSGFPVWSDSLIGACLESV